MSNFLERLYYKRELVSLKRELHSKQREMTKLFWTVKQDKERDIATDPELCKLNNEVDLIGMQVIDLDKRIYGKTSHYGKR